MVIQLKKYWLHGAFLFSLVAVLGSLYFSEIAQFPPCLLCWYQRAMMYPLPVLFGVALLKQHDKTVIDYALPLVAIGGLIAVYHNLLYYGVLAEADFTCREGISCTSKYIEWFGFVTIPLLSLVGFALLAGLMLVVKRAR